MSRYALVSVFKALAFWAIFQCLLISGVFSFLEFVPRWATGMLVGLLTSALMMAATWVFLKYDELTLQDLGLVPKKHSANRFIVSLLTGMVLFGLIYSAFYALTPINVYANENVNIFNTLVLILLLFIVLSLMEEILFRGYFMKKIESVIGIRASIYITSITFGLYHGISVDSITGPAIWGLWYGLLTYWSKGLAIPIGFHAGVNVTQGLFGEKDKWIDGIWSFELSESITLFTVGQIATAIQFALLVFGLTLIEYYLRIVRPRH
ncbi:CPBP family intramembrane glutamic endopeptidase [Paraglaciecola arctica]|uniref:CPBP family intramembrane glutamic endopeptidase n=1 Tax=Paraglaciecola arctica TaxID=1128911 RepID=UPI001C0692DD|nr:type II CAAX endopeptidase family protein [Paraglaciecola arctica]MBU3004480.1 CPBP family intramembrane metalloprotease [Paraglaciecola arctica]